MRVFRNFLAGLLTVACVSAAPAHAAYPDRPITIIVGSLPGGFTDFLARTIGQKLQEKLGQSVLVENKAGAAGTFGAAYVAKAAPDGYTLLLTHVMSNSVAPWLYANLRYDIVKDFTPIVRVASTPMLLTVNTGKVPVQDAKGVVDLLKSGKQYTFASSGVGSVQHLAGELFLRSTGAKMIHIPYKGSGQAIFDLVSGQVDMSFESPPNVLPQLKSGKLKVLAITSAERSPTLPDVPTMAEAGIAGAEATQWFGVSAPAQLPADITAKLNAAVNEVLQMPDIVERIKAQDATIIGGSSDDFATFIKTDSARWGELIKEAGIKNE